MARYIETSEATAVIADYFDLICDTEFMFDETEILRRMNANAIDAVPVKHGKWIDMADFEQCSVCTATHLKTIQTVYGKATWIKSDYCPSCGARMEE